MEWKRRYESGKKQLLGDTSICVQNRQLFKKFFEYEEYKLKRMNGLPALDEKSHRTVAAYVSRLRTVNRWFQNEPWFALTKQDIKQVYDDLEDGRILTLAGRRFGDRETYYRRILLGKPFELAGKVEIAKKVMEFRAPEKRSEVRFIKEETFRKLIDVVIKPEHKALLWLAWDIGENASSLLQLRRCDFTREINEHSKEPEYLIVLRREVLKRSRTPRTDITNYKETVRFLDLIIASHVGDDRLFTFGSRMAMKVLDRATRITGAKCIPGGQKVTLKDLRSSMACDLLSKSWTTDEVNQRLGHKPSSREIDKYVNWLALDRHRPKRKLHDGQVAEMQRRIEELREREKLAEQRQHSLQKEVEELRLRIERNNRLVHEQARIVKRLCDGLRCSNPAESLFADEASTT